MRALERFLIPIVLVVIIFDATPSHRRSRSVAGSELNTVCLLDMASSTHPAPTSNIIQYKL